MNCGVLLSEHAAIPLRPAEVPGHAAVPPAFLTGVSEHKQVLEVELFSDFTEDPVSQALLCECVRTCQDA